MVAGGPELEPLLGPEREHAVAHGDGSGGFPWLTVVGFAFLTSSSGMAISRSKGDMAAVAYVAFSYAGLVALFCCFRCYERARPGSLHREHLKSAVWMLTTLLTLLFSYKFASIAPVPVQILVWVIAGAFVFGGFYALFVVIDKSYDEESIPKEMGVIMLLTLRSVYYLLSPFALHIKDAIAAAFRNRRRVRTRAGGVLAALRRHWPRRADGNRAQDPSDIAWSVIRLIVDSGASRHAVGNTLLLEGVQFYSPLLSARLADGRNMRILGIGRIQRVGQFSIPNVDLVEGVQDGLISIPQLDREHGLIACFGNG